MNHARRHWLGAPRLVFALGVVLGLALALPGARFAALDGLPFSTPLEFGAVVVLVLFVLDPRLRRRVNALLHARKAWRRTAFGLIGVAILIKFVLLAAGPDQGFAACYTTPAAAGPRCEASYENTHGQEVTRVDDALDFRPGRRDTGELVAPARRTGALAGGIATTNWNLSFLNSLRFNDFDRITGDSYTERMPIVADWRGEIELPAARRARVTYVGDGAVRIGNRTTALSPSYGGPREVLLVAPAGRVPVRITYRFDNGYRAGRVAPPRGPYARFQLRWTDGELEAVRAAAPGSGWRLLGLVADLALGAVLLVLAGLAAARMRGHWRLLASVGAVCALVLLAPDPSPAAAGWLTLLGALGLVAYLIRRPSEGWLPAAFVGLLSLNIARAIAVSADLGAVVYRRPGSDWLTYESYARDILTTGSLEGAEPVFYAQPGYRYIAFALHRFLGDGDVLPSIAILTAIALAVLVAVIALTGGGRLDGAPGWLVLAGGLLTLLVLTHPTVANLARVGASEYPTWILLPLAFAALLASRRPGIWALGGVLLGISFAIRTNQALGIAYLLGVFVLLQGRVRPRGVGIAATGVLAVALLLPLHNLVYGGELVLLPTSGNEPNQIPLPPGELLRIFSSQEVRTAFEEHLRLMFFYFPEASLFSPPRVAFNGLLILWVLTVARVLARWRETSWGDRALSLWPLAYLLPYISLDIFPAYPRHIVIAYVAMGLTAIRLEAAAAARVAATEREAATNSRARRAASIRDRPAPSGAAAG